MAARHLPPDRGDILQTKMEDADALTAGSIRVRDMLEHFDQYEAGTGRMQVASAKKALDPGRVEDRAQAHLISFRRGETFSLVVGGEEIETSAVRAATRLLIDAIHQAAS